MLIGGRGNDAIDGGGGMDLILGDDALLDRSSHLDNFSDPRFESLIGGQMYSTAPTTAGQDLAQGTARLDPRGDPEGRVKRVWAPVWGDYLITEIGHTASAQGVAVPQTAEADALLERVVTLSAARSRFGDAGFYRLAAVTDPDVQTAAKAFGDARFSQLLHENQAP